MPREPLLFGAIVRERRSKKPKGKLHYAADAGTGERNSERVAVFCGAITVHSTPQLYVRETSDVTRVECGNCLRNLKKAALLT